MQSFAMRGDRNLRPQPGVHLRKFGAARMAGNVDELRAVSDDFDALRDEAVDDLADGLLVARNGPRGEDDDVARRQSGGRMLGPPAARVAGGCSSSAMRANAARDSPWLPVASAKTLARGMRSNWSWPTKAGRP